MRDVSIVSVIYCALFIVLTMPANVPYWGFSVETVSGLHYFLAELVFWAGALYICASGTMGAFARQDRFGLSQNYPLVNKICSVMLIVSPFLAVLWNVRFVYVLLGLLALSHLKSKTNDERKIEFTQSRGLSNIVLIMLFTLAIALMTFNNYDVQSIFNFGSLAETSGEDIQE